MHLELITGPATEPVTVLEAKSHARIETTADDTAIALYLATARERVELTIGRALLTQTWRLWLDAANIFTDDEWWDGTRDGPEWSIQLKPIELPYGPPLVQIVEVLNYDANGRDTALDPALYYADTVGSRLCSTVGSSWPAPGRVANGMSIEYVVGTLEAEDVPAGIKHAILETFSFLYEHRGDERVAVGVLPLAAMAVLQPYMSFAL